MRFDSGLIALLWEFERVLRCRLASKHAGIGALGCLSQAGCFGRVLAPEPSNPNPAFFAHLQRGFASQLLTAVFSGLFFACSRTTRRKFSSSCLLRRWIVVRLLQSILRWAMTLLRKSCQAGCSTVAGEVVAASACSASISTNAILASAGDCAWDCVCACTALEAATAKAQKKQAARKALLEIDNCGKKGLAYCIWLEKKDSNTTCLLTVMC